MIAPAVQLVAITPSDSADLANKIRGLYVGGAGDVKLVDWDGTTVTLKGMLVGNYYPIGATKIFATDTTATFLVGVL